MMKSILLKIVALIFYYYRTKEDEKGAHLQTVLILLAYIFGLILPIFHLLFGNFFNTLTGTSRILRYVFYLIFFIAPMTYLIKNKITINLLNSIELSPEFKRKANFIPFLIWISLMALFAFQALITKNIIAYILNM